MRCLVTGAAGFIGSHLSEALLAAGHEVSGLDAFIPYYPRANKERNLKSLLQSSRFTFHECDLRADDLAPILDGIKVIFHIAAMPGLLESWKQFDLYVSCNINATQRLLDAARQQSSIRQFIHASTSSIYGSYVVGPEATPAQPVSPYGITKLAGEHLVTTYGRQFDVPTSILRYFSVYGPRQRPDQGYQIFIERILNGTPITIFGDGQQSRANTYVGDVVRATLMAHENFTAGSVYNIGGVDEVNVKHALEILEEITGKPAFIQYGPERPGEQARTVADITLARKKLGYEPQVSIQDGLAEQVRWHLQQNS